MGNENLLVDFSLGSIVTLDFVPKMRGTDHDLSCYNPYISGRGIAVSPISTIKK